MSTDYIELTFKNGSTLQILSLSASSRGQRASGGSGLGLAIVQAIMTSSGGGITVSQTPGGGLTVQITFPIAPST